MANKRTYIYSACQPAQLNVYPVKSLLHLDHMGDAYSSGVANGLIVKIVSAFPFELSTLSLELLYGFEPFNFSKSLNSLISKFAVT